MIKLSIIHVPSGQPAALGPHQENKIGPWTLSSSAPTLFSLDRLPTWHLMNSTSSSWLEGLVCWPVLLYCSNNSDSLSHCKELEHWATKL